MLPRSVNVCVTLCLWITELSTHGTFASRTRQDDSFFTASIYRARCASRCLSLHITRISAFFKHSQVRVYCSQSLQLLRNLRIMCPPHNKNKTFFERQELRSRHVLHLLNKLLVLKCQCKRFAIFYEIKAY